MPGDGAQQGVATAVGRLTVDQTGGVRVLWPGQQVVFAAVLAEAPGIHHGNGVAGLRDHAEVVGDHDDRQPALIAQVQQQPQDLRLHRHIQGGGRLVGDQHFRVAAQRHGDHCALAHAAGKLVGVVVDARLGIGNAHLAQHVDGLQPGVFLRCTLVQANAFGNLFADAHQRIKVAAGVLENHAQLPAAYRAHPRIIQLQQVLPGQPYSTALHPQVGRWQQAHKTATGHGLARAALTHQAKDFALGQIERHAVDQGHLAPGIVGDHAEIAHLQHAHERSPSTCATPSASKLKPMAKVTMASPGKVQIHHAVVIKACPSATIVPHSAVGGCTPRPR
ncbi:hypothetical protein ALQ29_05619 [Pseudomonas marginalis pv. marginalis]|uniref:Uncharacterized protein n=1 Tax=Pseudomonas marginalis pv. marginalis TaxID=97473 RepID=A0A3M4B564_PSEMA|nr:hypothetical protein ALQ29_05619 [Pseudomonas marginalis pv. marginalis]